MGNDITGNLLAGGGGIFGAGQGVAIIVGLQDSVSTGSGGSSGSAFNPGITVQTNVFGPFAVQGSGEYASGLGGGSVAGTISGSFAAGVGFAIGNVDGASGFVGLGVDSSNGFGLFINGAVIGPFGPSPLGGAGGVFIPLPVGTVAGGMYSAGSSILTNPSSWTMNPMGDPTSFVQPTTTPDQYGPTVPASQIGDGNGIGNWSDAAQQYMGTNGGPGYGTAPFNDYGYNEATGQGPSYRAGPGNLNKTISGVSA